MLGHSGMTRCFRPLPSIRAVRDGANSTSDRRRPIASETRAPVLYIRANRTRSRWPLQVDPSGAARIAAISSRDRYPSRGRPNRFIGMARTRWTAGKQVGSRAAANFRNGAGPPGAAFRVRTQLPRTCSRWSRKARIAGASRSADAEGRRGPAPALGEEVQQQAERIPVRCHRPGAGVLLGDRAAGRRTAGRAWRRRGCRPSRSCRASGVGGGEPLEPGGGQVEQLGDAGEIPVGVADLGMAQVGRQGQDGVVEVRPLGVPAEEPPAGEGVPEVMDPRRTPPGARRGPGSSVRSFRKVMPDRRVDQRRAPLGDEERVGSGDRMATVPEPPVGRPAPGRPWGATGPAATCGTWTRGS